MPRAAVHEQLLMVKLPSSLKQRLRRAADKQRTDMSKLTREAIEEHLDRLEREAKFNAWAKHARGSATSGLTTDEIMALTRGE